MRYYNQQHRFYCGIDLHAGTMYLCILDHVDEIVFHKDLPTDADTFLEAIAPFRDDLVVCCECLFCWYWLADLCQAQNISFVLAHVLYMRAAVRPLDSRDHIEVRRLGYTARTRTRPRGSRTGPSRRRPAR